MKINKYTFWLLLANILILPVLGNESLNSFLHINGLVTLTNYLLPFLLSLLLFYDFKKNKIKFELNFATLVSICFIVIIFLSWISSVAHKTYTISNFFKFVVFIYLLNILRNIKLDDKQIKTINHSIIGLLIFTSFIGILQYLFQINLNTNGIEKYIGALGRANSTFYIATIFDKYLIVNILYCLFLFYNKGINKLTFIITFLLANLALIFTFSRTSLICLLAIYFILTIYFIIKKNYIPVMLILTVIIGGYFIPGQDYLYSSTANYFKNLSNNIADKLGLEELAKIPNSVLNLFIKNVEESESETEEPVDVQLTDNIDYSINSRNYFSNVAKNVMISNPVLGIGIGSYNYIYEEQNATKYIDDKTFDTKSRYLYPHNMYYHLGAEIGIFGMIIFFVIIAYLLIKTKNIFTWLLLLLILLSSYSESIFYMKDISYFIIILIALLSNQNFRKKSAIN